MDLLQEESFIILYQRRLSARLQTIPVSQNINEEFKNIVRAIKKIGCEALDSKNKCLRRVN